MTDKRHVGAYRRHHVPTKFGFLVLNQFRLFPLH
jgi:hypothetical protein